MSTRYRVMVERIEDVEGAQYETRETVLFEATSPSMERLAAFAPVEVLAALGGVAGALRMDGHVEADGNVVTYSPPVEPSPAEANREAMLRDEAAEAAKPKRARRSKAQIAADEAAARQVAEVVVSNAQAVAQVVPEELSSALADYKRATAGTAGIVAAYEQVTADIAAVKDMAQAGLDAQKDLERAQPPAPAAEYNPFLLPR